MRISQDRNQKVLRCLSMRYPDAPAFAPHDDIPDPYYRAGCHPEIVERVWDQIGAALPVDCRCLIHRTPALVHPASGIILATGIGTAYGLRLPGPIGTEASWAGAATTMPWSGGASMNIGEDFGDDWFFGGWRADEPAWCRRAYEMLAAVT